MKKSKYFELKRYDSSNRYFMMEDNDGNQIFIEFENDFFNISNHFNRIDLYDLFPISQDDFLDIYNKAFVQLLSLSLKITLL